MPVKNMIERGVQIETPTFLFNGAGKLQVEADIIVGDSVTIFNPGHADVFSDSASHFTGALAQDAKEDEILTIDAASANYRNVTVESVILQTIQPLDWEIWFWMTAGFDDTTLNNDYFIEYVKLNSANAKRIGNANQYYYAASGLNIPYVDDQVGGATSLLYCSLVNRSATAKIAGAGGAVRLAAMLRRNSIST